MPLPLPGLCLSSLTVRASLRPQVSWPLWAAFSSCRRRGASECSDAMCLPDSSRTGPRAGSTSSVKLSCMLWRDTWAMLVACTLWITPGVLSACVSGCSRDPSWGELLLHLERADEASPCLSWFHRLPSASNVADPPLRGNWHELNFLGKYEVDRPSCFATGRQLASA